MQSSAEIKKKLFDNNTRDIEQMSWFCLSLKNDERPSFLLHIVSAAVKGHAVTVTMPQGVKGYWSDCPSFSRKSAFEHAAPRTGYVLSRLRVCRWQTQSAKRGPLTGRSVDVYIWVLHRSIPETMRILVLECIPPSF